MTNHNPARAKADSPVAHHGEETDVKLAPAGARTPKDPSAFWLPLEVALLACFLVVGIQTLLIKHFAVNVPYWDEWSNFRLLQLYNDGTLTLQYLFLPHNEHRIFFPRLVSIGLYVLVGENHPVAQMLLSALIMGLCAGVWAFTLVRLKVSPWVALLASLALTSPAQWENILNGFQTCFWMMDCSAVLAICFVSLPVRVSWGTVAACAVACFVSTFSLASGLVSWGACGAILALRLWLDAPSLGAVLRDRGALAKLGAFVLATVACTGLYLYGYVSPAGHDPMRVRSLAEFLVWLARTLAYPLLEKSNPLAQAAAVAQWAVIIGALICYIVQLKDQHVRRRFALLVGILLFLLANGVIIAYGRGGQPAIASRYVTLLLWSRVVFIIAAADLLAFFARRSGLMPTVGLSLVSLALVALLTMYAQEFVSSLADLSLEHDKRIAQAETAARYLYIPTPPVTDSVPTPLWLFMEVMNDPVKRRMLPAWMRAYGEVQPSISIGDAWSAGGVNIPEPRRMSWGTWSGSGRYTGRIETAPFLVTQPTLIVAVTGYPNRTENSLIIESVDGSRQWLRYNDDNPGEQWGEWRVDVSALVGRQARIVAVDESTDRYGWLGFGGIQSVSPLAQHIEALLAQLELLLGGTLILIVTAALVINLTPVHLRSRPVALLTLLLVAAFGIYLGQSYPLSNSLASLQAQRVGHEPLALLDTLPPGFVDRQLLKRVPDGLFMHANGGLEFGPFTADSEVCFTSGATIDPSAPFDPRQDGVIFTAQVLTDRRLLSETSVTVTLGAPADVRLPLSTGTPFTLRLLTKMRANSVYDWAVWQAPQLGPCQN